MYFICVIYKSYKCFEYLQSVGSEVPKNISNFGAVVNDSYLIKRGFYHRHDLLCAVKNKSMEFVKEYPTRLIGVKSALKEALKDEYLEALFILKSKYSITKISNQFLSMLSENTIEFLNGIKLSPSNLNHLILHATHLLEYVKLHCILPSHCRLWPEVNNSHLKYAEILKDFVQFNMVLYKRM